MAMRPGRINQRRLRAIILFGGTLTLGHAGSRLVAFDQERMNAIEQSIADPGRSPVHRTLDPYRRPEELLALVEARPGDRVLDVLASPGYASELIAPLVRPGGSVTAYDPPQFVSAEAARRDWRARTTRHPNITQALAPLNDVRFPVRHFDRILLHLAYHETYWESASFGLVRMNPRRFARMLAESLRPGGRIVVIDHAASPGSDPRRSVDALHRIDPAVVIADFEHAGLTLVGESRAWRSPADNRRRSVYDAAVRYRTDRFGFVFARRAGRQ
jgi:predicted methyltransferase